MTSRYPFTVTQAGIPRTDEQRWQRGSFHVVTLKLRAIIQRLSNIFQVNCAFDDKSTKIGGKLDLNVLIQSKMAGT